MDFGVVLRSNLEPKSTKNRSKTVSKLRCKFECIFEGSWTPVGPILEAKMGPSWGHVGPMLALGPLKKSIQKTAQKTYIKRTPRYPRYPGHRGGGPLEQRKKEEKGYQGEKKMQKTPHCAQGAVVDIYIYIYIYIYTSVDMCISMHGLS